MLSGFELYPRWVPLMYRETLKYFSCAPATKVHDYWKKKKQTKAIKEQQKKETKTKKHETLIHAETRRFSGLCSTESGFCWFRRQRN